MRGRPEAEPRSVERSAYYEAFCVFKITYMRSAHEDWDDRVLEALIAAHRLLPRDEAS